MRSVVRATVVPLAALLAALVVLLSAVPAAAASPAPSLSVSQPATKDGLVSFVLTPRYVTTTLPQTVTVSSGDTDLSVQTTTATTDIAPRALVFVVDAGSSTTEAQLDAERAAVTAIGGGLPNDVAFGIVAASSTPIVALAPTAARSDFAAALVGIKASGSRALFDAVASAQGLLDATPAGSEKRIIIIGTGRDSSSTATSAGLAAKLGQDSVVVDAVLSTTDAPAPTQALVQSTGGHVRPAADFSAIGAVAQALASVFQPAIAVSAIVPPSLAGTSGQLDISIPGTKLVAHTPVTFGGTPAADPSAASTSFSWVPAWLGVLFAAVLFAALIIAILSLTWPRSLKQERIRQIANFGPGARAAAHAPKAAENAPISSMIARTALAATASVVRTGRMEERIARRLERAGMRIRPHEWVLLRACMVVTGGALLFTVTNWVGAIVGALIGWASTLLYQTVRIDRRSNQFAEQLPDALQLVIGSLKSGFSLPQAFESLVRESQEPVASEFGRALTEHRLGADISDALERVAQRSQSEDLGWTVMAVRIQREVGGNLAEVLQNTVDTMRERGRLRRHVRSLSAEGRLSAYVLIGLPIVLGLFMFIYRRKYMEPLITDPLGIIMLSVGGLLFILGIFWMTRVVKVEA